MTELTSQQLKEILTYNSKTGQLFWKERKRSLFSSDRVWKLWNTKFAGTEAFTAKHNAGYRHGSIFNKQYLKHRVVMCLITGKWPDQVDHRNQNRTDDKLSNMTPSNSVHNQRNRSMIKPPFSGIMGVYFDKRRNKWRATICISGKQISLGYFIDKKEAAKARKQAEQEYRFSVNHGRKRERHE